jgi:hypothetical protein
MEIFGEIEGSFLKSIERPSSLPMQISTRYLQFGQSAGIGKKSTV